MNSRHKKGVILADETGLGKASETFLVMAQYWYVGKQRILLIVPTHLLQQWMNEFDEKLLIPAVSIDSKQVFDEQVKNGQDNPFLQESIVVTTYDFAAEKADYIAQIEWDLTVFEEAHRLRCVYTGENRGALELQKAVQGSFKLLLTATPMQNSVMDLYTLINFIDENIFTSEKIFQTRYLSTP